MTAFKLVVPATSKVNDSIPGVLAISALNAGSANIELKLHHFPLGQVIHSVWAFAPL